MNEIEKQFRAQLGPNYDHSAKPVVYFFDHAIEIQSDGRPRFKNAVYISKTSKTAADTASHNRKMLPEDKTEFPEEWAYYLKVKDNLKKPRIGLLPGIDKATEMEMKAIEIYNLEQLVAQEHFTEWKQLAERILNAINVPESGNKDTQKEALQGDNGGLSNGVLGVAAKENYQENQPQKVTFNYEMSA